MTRLIHKLSDSIDLSSPVNFLLALLACVMATCILAHTISIWAFNIRTPEMMAVYSSIISEQTLITSFVISTFFFTISLSLIRHINELRQELVLKVKYDNLTGLLSREAFLNEMERKDSLQREDAFLLIDADFFKRINDKHGHGVGDKALVTITEALKKGIRSSDAIGRIGGEEFAVHLSNVDKKLALDIAERLRENVLGANETFDYEGVDLSISIGVVVYKRKIDLPTLMQKADELLYAAKENGRNRVEHVLLGSAIMA